VVVTQTSKVLTGRAEPFPSEGEEAFHYWNGIQSFLRPSTPLLYNLFITEIWLTCHVEMKVTTVESAFSEV